MPMNYDNIINKNKPMTYKLQTKDNKVFTQMAFDLVQCLRLINNSHGLSLQPEDIVKVVATNINKDK